jgi:hypothetical protein
MTFAATAIPSAIDPCQILLRDSTADVADLAGLLESLGYPGVTAITDSGRFVTLLKPGQFNLISLVETLGIHAG